MDNHQRVVNSLKANLSKDLPGFAVQNRMAPSFRGGFPFHSTPDSNTRESAVLICIYPFHSQPTTILIKRSTYNGAHSGQVSFPGGKSEEGDKSLIGTALREAKEEVGIDPALVEIIGQLTPLFIPVTNLMVLPIVGLLTDPPELHLNLHEVEYTIAVDLLDFKDTRKKTVKTICINSLPISAPYYSVCNEDVWGATAMIISELTELY